MELTSKKYIGNRIIKIFTPGDMSVFIHTKESLPVREFKENNYTEIEKEEYTELLSGFLDFDA